MDAIGLGWVVMEQTRDRPTILQKAGGMQGVFVYMASRLPTTSACSSGSMPTTSARQ
jgi:hypothetical protein